MRRLFKDTTGMGLREYIDQAKAGLFRQLLRETGLNLDQVAERCGFGSERLLRRSWQRRTERFAGEIQAPGVRIDTLNVQAWIRKNVHALLK